MVDKAISPDRRRTMTLLDAILVVGSAAVGMGMFQWARRALFRGWIWIIDHGLPDSQNWSAERIIVTCSDIMVFFIPLVAPWTVLLILLRMRPPRPAWRWVWRQPGMAACLAAILGWCWSGLALLLAVDLDYLARSNRTIPPDRWAQKYLADEVFMYVGLAIAAVWTVQFLSGRWRRSADWIDLTGRVVGVLWILIGLVWTFREYLDFL
jgi:hypothetical protein